eukprot:TRINITY_DN52138_c0_g1_i1.p1 TRINITY_DN52138_c0_g1~~TRINITY_DN52138_c0_g1_i1.p1  ORF type:complete len:251 (-),score=38.55 TRINITY_DN52138_c0_g1_i1:436-1188(-)
MAAVVASVFGRSSYDEVETAADPEAETEEERILRSMPPLPTPNYKAMRAQACGGVCMVMAITTFCVGATRAGMKDVRDMPDGLWWLIMGGIHLEAALAVICLIGLLLGNPGVIERSLDSCFPLPEDVAERLSKGESMNGLQNVQEGNRSYCLRCLVWRDHDTSQVPQSLRGVPGCKVQPHHCRICNRCVRNFDHHCGVFGRCIAGRGIKGNMGFFMGIILMGYLGMGTCMLSVTVGASYRPHRFHGLGHH